MTSTPVWGTCSLAQYGYWRDKKKGKLQIIFGLLCCNVAAWTIALEVFEGNINDAKTLSPVLKKVRDRFGIKQLVLVGDRGILTSARIEEELKGREDLDAHYRVKIPQIRELVEDSCDTIAAVRAQGI